MKRNLLLSILLLFSISVWAQENLISVNGGYAMANLDDADANTTGYKISLSYEQNLYEGHASHGAVIGYISTKASVDTGGNQQAEYEINSWPVYYVPKYLFGGGAFRGFIKGAVGIHFSNYKKTGILTITDDNIGFYGGVGLGAIQTINSLFISLEYEGAYMGNSGFRDGFMNTVLLGVGIKF